MTYEELARRDGEIRIYLQTAEPIDGVQLWEDLAYRFAADRPPHTDADPWDYAFRDPGPTLSEAEFLRERDRILGIFTLRLHTAWEADILYHPAGQALHVWHWSSTEAMVDHRESVNLE